METRRFLSVLTALLVLAAIAVTQIDEIIGEPFDIETGPPQLAAIKRMDLQPPQPETLTAAPREVRVILARGARSIEREQMAVLQATLQKVRELLNEGRTEVALAILEETANRRPLETQSRVFALIQQARVTVEFARLPLSITGVLSGSGGASVILDGEVYESGEYVNEDMFVKTVRTEAIEFVYKGATVVKTF